MIKKVVLALYFLALYAEQEEPQKANSAWKNFSIASVGYRRDRQHFKNPIVESSYTKRNTVQLALGSQIEWKDLVLQIRGCYGWLVNGNFDFSFGSPYVFGTNELGAGYTADALGALGYRLKLLQRKAFAAALLASGGYKYSHLMNFPEGENTDHFTISGLTAFALDRFTNPNQQDWFGPFVEGRLELRIIENIKWDLFYQYHWPSLRSKSTEALDLYLFVSPSTADFIGLARLNSMYQASDMNMHIAGTDFIYRVPSGWLFGIHFEGSVAWTESGHYRLKKVIQDYISSPGITTARMDDPASIHWVSYEASFAFGTQF